MHGCRDQFHKCTVLTVLYLPLTLSLASTEKRAGKPAAELKPTEKKPVKVKRSPKRNKIAGLRPAKIEHTRVSRGGLF